MDVEALRGVEAPVGVGRAVSTRVRKLSRAGLDQGNAEHTALALPIHAAWAFALARLRADSGAAAP